MKKHHLLLHKYLGLTFGLWFFLLTFTGCFLVYREELTGFLVADPVLESASLSYADILDQQAGCTSLRLDKPTSVSVTSYYLLHCDGVTRVLNDAGEVQPSATMVAQVFDVLFTVHHDLYLPGGAYVQGAVGLLMLYSLYSGLRIWLRLPGGWRRKTKVSFKAPRQKLYFDLHKALGLCGLPVGVLVVVFGTMLALNSLVPLPKQAGREGEAMSCSTMEACLLHIETLADAAYPISVRMQRNAQDGTVFGKIFVERQVGPFVLPKKHLLYGKGPSAGASAGARIKTPGEATLWGRFTSWLYPLHTGKAMPLYAKPLVLLTGLIFMGLLVLGGLYWFGKPARRRP